MNLRHLSWLPWAAGVGFAAAFVFGDLLLLPVDLYYLLYFSCVIGFFLFYAARTRLDIAAWIRRRWLRGIVLGVVVGIVLMRGVLDTPETPALSGGMFWWTLIWRGVIYGAVDGLLLLSLPWTIVWRALDAERGTIARKVLASALAWIGVLVVTTAYHAGYRDFRSAKLVQPNIGSTIGMMSTIVTASPVASVVSHAFLHVTAVIHAPGTDLFLPPHRDH
jgi:hypothetical protein